MENLDIVHVDPEVGIGESTAPEKLLELSTAATEAALDQVNRKIEEGKPQSQAFLRLDSKTEWLSSGPGRSPEPVSGSFHPSESLVHYNEHKASYTTDKRYQHENHIRPP